ncbi:transposase [Streptomyces sp. BE20]|nr:transposase [Streptomyces sp. BE20]MEE1820884.1 transposase [Streptomyces sp. BE20]
MPGGRLLNGKSRALWEAVKDLPAPWRVESINSRLRKATRNRGHFPSEQAALKVLYLAVRELIAPRARDVNRVAAHWKEALNQFSLFFEDRLSIR